MKHEIAIPGPGALGEAAKEFLKQTAGSSLIAFYAPMGAGKTTFISALCRELGVEEDAVGSPTFALVNEYRTRRGESIFHFDFYRIESLAEALDTGLYDYLDSGSLCLMEWPENVEALLPEETLKVSIRVCDDGSRILEWEQ